jgi:monoterpene epsilon-lactone hydrolase
MSEAGEARGPVDAGASGAPARARMSNFAEDTAALPSYARIERHPGGTLRRWWLHLMLRLTARRMKVLGVDITVLRAQMARFDAKIARVDPETRRAPVDCAGVAAEWIDVPESRPERMLLYLHGGAFMFRYPGTHAGMVSRWCRALGARALLPDYRLAPEHPYPAAPDDCHAAYRWLLAQGHDPRHIVIAGDSAGGNLTLVTLQRIRAAGEPLPACAVVLSPVVDFTLSSRSMVTHERRDPIFRLASLVLMRGMYARPEQFLDPGVSPLFGDFSGLPPLLFQAGSLEALQDESVRAAQRAHAAGVFVELEIWERMAHVFQAQPLLPQAGEALGNIVRFIGARAGWTR